MTAVAMPFRLGLSSGVYPYGFPDAAWFGKFAARVEEWGFDDVVCCADRPTWPHPILDPLVLLSIAAATSRRADLIGMVVSPQRGAVLLAKELASIDYVAGGRLHMALGVGGDYPAEMRACGVDPAERRGRFEEGMAVMRALWRGTPVTFSGRHHELDACEEMPRPPRGTVPLWLAHRARSEASIVRTALEADGWMPSWVSPRRLQQARTRILALAREHGRPGTLDVGALIRIYFAPTEEAAAHQVASFRARTWGHPYEPERVRHLQAVGPPEVCRRRLAEFVAAGANRIILQAECPWPEFEAQLRLIRGEILDRREEIGALARELHARPEGRGEGT